MNRCPGRARHRRIAWGTVGLRTPVCVYCGSPNPRPLTRCEWDDLADWINSGANVGEHVRAAMAARPQEATS